MPRSWRWGLALLAVAVIATVLVSRSGEERTKGERFAAAVREFHAAGNRMTPEEVRQSFGEPDEVSRNSPRALCWAYHQPYQVRMCWGPKRQAAWIGHNVPMHNVSRG